MCLLNMRWERFLFYCKSSNIRVLYCSHWPGLPAIWFYSPDPGQLIFYFFLIIQRYRGDCLSVFSFFLTRRSPDFVIFMIFRKEKVDRNRWLLWIEPVFTWSHGFSPLFRHPAEALNLGLQTGYLASWVDPDQSAGSCKQLHAQAFGWRRVGEGWRPNSCKTAPWLLVFWYSCNTLQV